MQYASCFKAFLILAKDPNAYFLSPFFQAGTKVDQFSASQKSHSNQFGTIFLYTPSVNTQVNKQNRLV